MTFHLQNNTPSTFTIRLGIGIVQGVALYILGSMASGGTTGTLSAWLYTLLVISSVVLPPVWLAGLTTMRPVTLIAWTATIAASTLAVATHAAWRNPGAGSFDFTWLVFPLAAAVFIGHNLVAAADADGRPFARYYSYFDISWRNGIQFALCVAFVGAFWLLLFLGAGLFDLINISIVRDIIEKAAFAYLATCVGFALAVQITSERISLVTGARTIALLLLGWLLPVLTLFAVAFLGSLAFTGLAPLWATGHATALLVVAGASLIVLINATYQDGSEEHVPASVLRLSARIAALALGPITVIAFYSIWLRVEQYGLTPQRVIGLAIIALGAAYATGYVMAAVWPGRWLRPVETTNVAAATLCVVLIVSLLTPIADPGRLSVDDQVARLHAGRTELAKFDFDFLKFDAGRYGLDALERLAKDKSTPTSVAIAAKADEARQRKQRASAPDTQVAELSVEDLRKKITVLPAGSTLPDSFLTQDWTNAMSSPRVCVREATTPFQCEALLADIDRDNVPEILLRANNYDIAVFHQAPGGKWELLGRFGTVECDTGTAGNFGSGAFRTVPPLFNDLEVKGHRLHIDTPCLAQPQPDKPLPK